MDLAFIISGVIAIYLLFYRKETMLSICLVLLLVSFFVPSITVGQLQLNILTVLVLIVYALYALCVNKPISYTCITISVLAYIFTISCNFTYSFVLDNYVVWLCLGVVCVLFKSKYMMTTTAFYLILVNISTAVASSKYVPFVSIFEPTQTIQAVYVVLGVILARAIFGWCGKRVVSRFRVHFGEKKEKVK